MNKAKALKNHVMHIKKMIVKVKKSAKKHAAKKAAKKVVAKKAVAHKKTVAKKAISKKAIAKHHRIVKHHLKVQKKHEKIATKAGDSFISAERVLTAIALAKGTEAAKILDSAGVKPQPLNAAINDLRKGRTADSAGAEDNYDALKKYARDLTEAARDGLRIH